MNLKSLLNNKYFYYATVFLMAVNILGYISLGSIECVLVFGIAAYAANHFTKNRVLDIFIGLFASNILFGCGRIREGMESTSDKLQKCANELTKKACDENDKCNWDSDKNTCVEKLKKAAEKTQEASTATKKAENDLEQVTVALKDHII